MNDNELPQTSEWVRIFDGRGIGSLRSALGVLAGLLDDPSPFLNCARAIHVRNITTERGVRMADIMEEICLQYSLTHAQLISSEKSRCYTIPRQELMFRAFTECPHLSYPDIARRIGGRDHTTCLHGVKAHCKRIELDYEEAKQLRQSSALSRGIQLRRNDAAYSK